MCLLLFIVFWLGMFIIAGVSVQRGEPGRLVYGTDYKGDTCGTGALVGKTYTYYPKIMGTLCGCRAGGGVAPRPGGACTRARLPVPRCSEYPQRVIRALHRGPSNVPEEERENRPDAPGPAGCADLRRVLGEMV